MEPTNDTILVQPNVEEESSASLSERLYNKLSELDATYRNLSEEINKVDAKIIEEQKKLQELPRRVDVLKGKMDGIHNTCAGLQEMINKETQIIESLRRQEQESMSHIQMRKDLLSEVCTNKEQMLVNDAVDVRTGEIRRHISLRSNNIDELKKTMAEHQRALLDIETTLNNENLMTIKKEIMERIKLCNVEKEQLSLSTNVALQKLRECQRLISDLNERNLLIEYAKKNGLELKTGTTDELVFVCRTHQQKILEKNRAVDGPTDRKTRPSRNQQQQRKSVSRKKVAQQARQFEQARRRPTHAPAPNEPVPVDVEFSVRHMSNRQGSNNSFRLQNIPFVLKEDRELLELSEPSSGSSSESRGSSSRRSREWHKNHGHVEEVEEEDEQTEPCDCESCKMERSRFIENIRRDNGFTVAAAQNVRRGQNANPYNDNGWTRFSYQ